jgi:copper(I)-binding protein
MSLKHFPARLLLSSSLLLAALPAFADIDVSKAWVRATVPGQGSTGAYMVIRSDHEVTLVGVKSELADHAAVHEMHMHDNMMMMMPVDKITIGAGHELILDEHNYHVMLEDLHHPLKAGETFPMVLRFVGTHGEKHDIKVNAMVRDIAAHDDEHAMHHHDMHDMHDMGH